MKTSEYTPSPWGLALLSPGALNRLSISFGRFFVGVVVVFNMSQSTDMVTSRRSVHLTSDPGI